jgi:hypothetical protein
MNPDIPAWTLAITALIFSCAGISTILTNEAHKLFQDCDEL